MSKAYKFSTQIESKITHYKTLQEQQRRLEKEQQWSSVTKIDHTLWELKTDIINLIFK